MLHAAARRRDQPSPHIPVAVGGTFARGARLLPMAIYKRTPMRRTPGLMSVASLLVVAVAAQERPLPEREEFLRETRKHLQPDTSLQSSYVHVESRREQKLDKRGRVLEESVKVFESYPGLPGENRWERLIAEKRTAAARGGAREGGSRLTTAGRGPRQASHRAAREGAGAAGARSGGAAARVRSHRRRHLHRLRHRHAGA